MRVFLTGGTGFIGGELARRLRRRGDEVVALVRDPAAGRALAADGCELVPGTVVDDQALEAGMRTCDVVIHSAAVYRVGVPVAGRQVMYRTNVVGTQRVLRAAAESGVRRIVHVSTVNVFGNTGGRVVDERHERTGGYLSAYDETKHLAHRSAQRFTDDGLPCLIVQPGAVYGPGDRSELGILLHRFLDGRLPVLAFAGAGVSAVHRDDVADGILRALDAGTVGHSYVLGGEITTVGGMVGVLAALTGRRAPRVRIPVPVLRMLTPLGPMIARVSDAPPNLREVLATSEGVTFWASHAKATAAFGYRPRPLDEGLSDMLVQEGRR